MLHQVKNYKLTYIKEWTGNKAPESSRFSSATNIDASIN